jgi:hypothetical protein
VTYTENDDPNSAPTAVDDSYSMQQDGTLTVNAPGVLANDSDPDGDPLTAALQTTPTNGSASVNGDGSFSYTPDDGFIGTDTFTYVASDGFGGADKATVTITVNQTLPTGQFTVFMPALLK